MKTYNADRGWPARWSKVAPLAGWYLRARMLQEMSDLDDRMLADIGVSRSEIPHLVGESYRATPAVEKSKVWELLSRLSSALVRMYRRRKLYGELSALDDRMLADIGISRFEIPETVKNAYPSAPATKEQPAAADAKAPAPAAISIKSLPQAVPANDAHHPLAA